MLAGSAASESCPKFKNFSNHYDINNRILRVGKCKTLSNKLLTNKILRMTLTEYQDSLVEECFDAHREGGRIDPYLSF